MREAITVQEIDNYKDIVKTQGVNGAIEIYDKLRRKGYGYAGWAGGVAANNTITGESASRFMQYTSGGISTDTVNKIKTAASRTKSWRWTKPTTNCRICKAWDGR